MQRVVKGFCAKEVAEKIGVEKSVIGLWERDVEFPDEGQWYLLQNLLELDGQFKPRTNEYLKRLSPN